MADDGKSVLLRNEIHMGIAVATPDGLTVPVLRHPDQKSIKQIAVELGELGQKARDKKLSPKDLQGANFTITSLGSIGGTAFTPLVNWPQWRSWEFHQRPCSRYGMVKVLIRV